MHKLRFWRSAEDWNKHRVEAFPDRTLVNNKPETSKSDHILPPPPLPPSPPRYIGGSKNRIPGDFVNFQQKLTNFYIYLSFRN